MSSFSFELLSDEPILIATIYPSFTLRGDFERYLSEAASTLDSLDQPVCYITNIHDIKMDVFQDFLVGINKSFRGAGAVIHHPNYGPSIIVSTDKLMKLAAKGLNSEIFGNLSIPVFDTLDEALDHARALIEQE